MNEKAVTIDSLFEELDKGRVKEAAKILRQLASMSDDELKLFADYLDPEPDAAATTPFVFKLVRPVPGRPIKTYSDKARILRTVWGVEEEQQRPVTEADKWVDKRKPRTLALMDYAARVGRSVSSVKADLTAYNRRRKPKK
jgi:hypothetical protein